MKMFRLDHYIRVLSKSLNFNEKKVEELLLKYLSNEKKDFLPHIKQVFCQLDFSHEHAIEFYQDTVKLDFKQLGYFPEAINEKSTYRFFSFAFRIEFLKNHYFKIALNESDLPSLQESIDAGFQAIKFVYDQLQNYQLENKTEFDEYYKKYFQELINMSDLFVKYISENEYGKNILKTHSDFFESFKKQFNTYLDNLNINNNTLSKKS